MAAEPASGTREHHVVARAQAPIRWPRPDRRTVALIGLWVSGLLGALLLPALVVSPGATTAPTGRIVGALALTVAGAVVMMLAAFGLWRRNRDPYMSVLGGVPAIACIAGGIMLAASKLYG